MGFLAVLALEHLAWSRTKPAKNPNFWHDISRVPRAQKNSKCGISRSPCMCVFAVCVQILIVGDLGRPLMGVKNGVFGRFGPRTLGVVANKAGKKPKFLARHFSSAPRSEKFEVWYFS